MVFYFILFILLLLISFIPRRNVNLRIMFFSIALSYFFSVRDYSVGTDTINYVNNYINYSSISESKTEIGYNILVVVLRYLHFSVRYFLFIVSFLSLIGLLLFYKEQSKNYFLSIILGFLLGSFFLNINIFRQSIAISLVAISLLFYLKRMNFCFLLFAFIAFTFHKSALIFLVPIILIKFIKNGKILYTTYLFISMLLIFFWDYLKYFISEDSRYTGYASYDEGGGVLVVLFNIILLLVFITLGKKEDFLIKFFAFSVFLGSALVFLDVNPSGPLRLIYYFTWASSVIIVNLITDSFSKKYKPLVVVSTIFLSLIYFYFFLNSLGGLSSYTFDIGVI